MGCVSYFSPHIALDRKAVTEIWGILKKHEDSDEIPEEYMWTVEDNLFFCKPQPFFYCFINISISCRAMHLKSKNHIASGTSVDSMYGEPIYALHRLTNDAFHALMKQYGFHYSGKLPGLFAARISGRLITIFSLLKISYFWPMDA